MRGIGTSPSKLLSSGNGMALRTRAKRRRNTRWVRQLGEACETRMARGTRGGTHEHGRRLRRCRNATPLPFVNTTTAFSNFLHYIQLWSRPLRAGLPQGDRMHIGKSSATCATFCILVDYTIRFVSARLLRHTSRVRVAKYRK